MWLLVKDADLYPVRVRSVRFTMTDADGHVRRHDFEPDARCALPLQHLAFPLPRDGLRGTVRVTGFITVDNARGKTRVLENHNLPGLAPWPLTIDCLEAALPYPREWRAGELHCHSEFTSDHVEFGAPLTLMQQTADAVGLDFVLCTDHSYDFPYRRDRYLESVDPHASFADYRAQVAALNDAHPHLPTVIAGEEISCGNARGQNIHLLAFGHDAFIPGNGDGGRRGLDSRPDLSLRAVLEQLGDTPSFAAHPAGHQGKLEQWILGRGPWRAEDVRTTANGAGGVRGLQFWNGTLDRTYHDGKALWIAELLRGNRLLPLGANDAHGDFNRSVGVRIPLISLKQGRGHVFGRVRTLLPAATAGADDLRAAFNEPDARCVCTDGPFAELTREGGMLRAAAFSTADFGALRSVTAYAGVPGDASERLLSERVFGENGDGVPLHFEERFEAPARGYVRLEAVTRRGRRALTAALFA